MKEITPEQEAQAEEQMKQARIKAVKAMKLFCEKVIISLPDEFPFDQKTLDEIMPERTQEVFKGMIEEGMCLEDINGAIDMLGIISSFTINRCKNQTKAMLVELYKQKIGYYEPEKEMPINEIESQLLNK